jgi:hypothetical protein
LAEKTALNKLARIIKEAGVMGYIRYEVAIPNDLLPQRVECTSHLVAKEVASKIFGEAAFSQRSSTFPTLIAFAHRTTAKAVTVNLGARHWYSQP